MLLCRDHESRHTAYLIQYPSRRNCHLEVLFPRSLYCTSAEVKPRSCPWAMFTNQGEECEKEKPKCGQADKESNLVSDHTHPFLITVIRLQVSKPPKGLGRMWDKCPRGFAAWRGENDMLLRQRQGTRRSKVNKAERSFTSAPEHMVPKEWHVLPRIFSS